MPGLVSFPRAGRDARAGAGGARRSRPTRWATACRRLPDGLSGELMDVASGAFGEYEGRDATGKITLSELSYHPARHEKQRISAHHGRDRLRDDELGAPGEHGGAVRLGEARLGQSDARDLQDRDGDAALHRHRPHRRAEAARDAEGGPGARLVPRQRRERLAPGADHGRRDRRAAARRFRGGRRPSGFLARAAGDRQRRRQRLHHGAGAGVRRSTATSCAAGSSAASGPATRPAP